MRFNRSCIYNVVIKYNLTIFIVLIVIIFIISGFLTANTKSFEWNACVVGVAICAMIISATHSNKALTQANKQHKIQIDLQKNQFFFEKRIGIINELYELVEEIKNRNIEKRDFYQKQIQELSNLNRFNNLEEYKSYFNNRETMENIRLEFDMTKIFFKCK